MTEAIDPTLLLKNAQLYRVGGCVRDYVLGQPSMDVDYVVVGSTPEAMLAAGFRQVGADFPVFLHPDTHDEYALARTERKNGHGYHGFSVYSSPDVTLEEDLSRRDFTMNAMAMDDKGKIIDPFHGRQHLQERVLRHVGDAFVEDPLRVLRGARFAAKYGLTIHPDTVEVMRQLRDSGEMDHLVPERVRVELEKAAPEHRRAMWDILREGGFMGRLGRLVPDQMAVPEVYAVLDKLAAWEKSPGSQANIAIDPYVAMWAALIHTAAPERGAGKAKTWMQDYKLPGDCVYAAATLNALRRLSGTPTPTEAVTFWTATDARRKGRVWEGVMNLGVGLGITSMSEDYWKGVDRLCRSVDEAKIAQACKDLTGGFKALPDMVFKERVDVFHRAMENAIEHLKHATVSDTLSP